MPLLTIYEPATGAILQQNTLPQETCNAIVTAMLEHGPRDHLVVMIEADDAPQLCGLCRKDLSYREKRLKVTAHFACICREAFGPIADEPLSESEARDLESQIDLLRP